MRAYGSLLSLLSPVAPGGAGWSACPLFSPLCAMEFITYVRMLQIDHANYVIRENNESNLSGTLHCLWYPMIEIGSRRDINRAREKARPCSPGNLRYKLVAPLLIFYSVVLKSPVGLPRRQLIKCFKSVTTYNPHCLAVSQSI